MQTGISGFTFSTVHRQYCLTVGLALCCALLTRCDSDSATGTAQEPAAGNNLDSASATSRDFDPAFTASIRQLTDAYLLQIDADFSEVSNSLSMLQSSVSDFLDSPTASSMDRARESWIHAHSAYELTTLHRYFANRVLPDPQGLQLFQLQYQINQWPILPGYLDYVGDYADSGIVHDTTVVLSSESLRDQHGAFAVTEATLGFHVIEYLLWGLNSDKQTPRPVADYLQSTVLTSAQVANGITLDQLPTNRRRQLLLLTTDSLQVDLQSLIVTWNGMNLTVRNQLQAMNGPQLLSVLTGAMTDMLTEELLVRSLYPLLNGDYVDSIQSPYSHATQNAVSAQLSGLERLLLETRTREGETLDSLISILSADFADFFYQNFDTSKECLVLLYATLQDPADSPAAGRAEFEIVECINLITNMTGHLGQVMDSSI